MEGRGRGGGGGGRRPGGGGRVGGKGEGQGIRKTHSPIYPSRARNEPSV